MTLEEIVAAGTWECEGEGELQVPAHLFGLNTVKVQFLAFDLTPDNPAAALTPAMVQGVNDFLALNEAHLPQIKALLHRHCLDCCGSISYGVELRPGETERDANLREFEIANVDDAFRKAQLSSVLIEDDTEDGLQRRYVSLRFNPPWQHGHGCRLLLQDGVLLDTAEDGGSWRRKHEA